jgi:hypothetical protein
MFPATLPLAGRWTRSECDSTSTRFFFPLHGFLCFVRTTRNTVLECIDAGTAYLEKRGVDDARRNMQLLVAHHLKCTRMQLYLRFDQPLVEDVLALLARTLKNAASVCP